MGYLYFFFFFQAEDGIRDGTVTGVQTCALPISFNLLSQRTVAYGSGRLARADEVVIHDYDPAELERCQAVAAEVTRSEERRVGKECRSRWSTYREKKKESDSVSREDRDLREYYT